MYTGYVRNWENEFAKWCPSMKVTVYHGPDRESVAKKLRPIAR